MPGSWWSAIDEGVRRSARAPHGPALRIVRDDRREPDGGRRGLHRGGWESLGGENRMTDTNGELWFARERVRWRKGKQRDLIDRSGRVWPQFGAVADGVIR